MFGRRGIRGRRGGWRRVPVPLPGEPARGAPREEAGAGRGGGGGDARVPLSGHGAHLVSSRG